MEIKEPLSLLLSIIFITLSLIHFYWLFGGKWGLKAVFPTKANGESINNTSDAPPHIATFLVAIGLGFFAWVSLSLGNWFTFQVPYLKPTGWVIAAIFGLRSIGDFKYVGLFKKIRNTTFALMDNKLYIPLCLCLTLSLIILLTQL